MNNNKIRFLHIPFMDKQSAMKWLLKEFKSGRIKKDNIKNIETIFSHPNQRMKGYKNAGFYHSYPEFFIELF